MRNRRTVTYKGMEWWRGEEGVKEGAKKRNSKLDGERKVIICPFSHTHTQRSMQFYQINIVGTVIEDL